jgi:hypothetical protein
MRAVLGSAFQQHEIARLVDIAIIVDDLALQHQELLVTRVFVRLAGGSRRHAIDVKARALRKRVVQLKKTLPLDCFAIDDEWLECRLPDIHHTPFRLFNLAHCRFLLPIYRPSFAFAAGPRQLGTRDG